MKSVRLIGKSWWNDCYHLFVLFPYCLYTGPRCVPNNLSIYRRIVSFDSEFVHNAWRNTPVENGGIGAVKYAMVADIKREIQQAYGIEHPDAGVALRGSFLIDANGIVRHQVVNDLPLGRNIDEMLRMVDALQFHEEHGEVCPAQWEKGKEGMAASPDGVAKYLSENVSSL